MAVDFESELMMWTSDQYYSTHVHKIQLPFNQVRRSLSCQPLTTSSCILLFLTADN